MTAARRRFAAAVREGEPALSQFVEWQVAVTRRYVTASDAEQCRAAIAPDHLRIVVPGPAELDYATEVQRVLTTVVHERTEALNDELQAELDQAGR